MRAYNEYVNVVRNRLRNYKQFEITIENLKAGIAAKEEDLKSDVNAPISKYGDMPSGGKPELNAVESAAERHMMIRREIDGDLHAIADIERAMDMIERAISGLNDVDQRLIKGHYFDGLTWEELGSELYYSEKWARERAGKAVKEMAGMIFGPKAVGRPVQTHFVFTS